MTIGTHGGLTKGMGWVEILVEKDVLANNMRFLRDLSKNARFYAVVKSDGYGHGMVECARIFLENGADALAVSLVDEALELKESGVEGDVLLLAGFLPGEEEVVVKGGFEVAVSDLNMLKVLGKMSERLDIPVNVHLKIDTGMGRLGFTENEISDALDVVKSFRGIKLVGIMSHFSVADERDEESVKFTLSQISSFKNIIKKYGFSSLPVLHIANSAGLLFYPEALFTGVRVGIALYGGIKHPALKEAMHVRTRLLSVRTVPSGWSISYGRTYKTSKIKRIGVIPFGYALGYIRKFSNKAFVVVNNVRVPVLGRVCMDLTVVDLDNVDAYPGDYVYILGGEKERISVFELSKWCDTITYEIFCQLGGGNTKVKKFI